MPEEEQNLSAAMRVARRSVWEQAKAAGIQNDETPPPVPTGKETGLNDDPRIATLEGIVRDLAGRLDDLEDDYPESETGNGVGGDIATKFSLYPKRLSDHLFVCSGGMWFHKTALYEFSEQHFWTGESEECPDGAIWISNNILPVCVYIEIPSKTWGYTTDFNSGLVGGTTYLRRSIFSIEFEVDGTPTNMIARNAGDIYS